MGTEFSNYDMIFEQDWRFEHLAHELTEGELAQGNVYLFGGTEGLIRFFFSALLLGLPAHS